MSQSIGSIYVDLQANSGTFVSELSKAAVAAQRAARDISGEFKRLGDVASQTFGAFGNFNPVISKLSFALESAGSAASSAMKNLSGLGGALGPLAALGAGAAAGLAAVAIGAVGIAVSAAESADHMYHLALSTGVSASSFAAWSFAAKQADLDQEQVARSLQILSANMVKVAEAPAGASNVFKNLGLSVRQTNGELKSAGDFMIELLRRLSEMSDKTAAVGLARQALGRGGAQMLQLGDTEDIEHLLNIFKQLNPNFDASAAAAHKFETELGLLKAEGESFSNKLMADLLPALEQIVERLAAGFGDPNSSLNAWIDRIANLTKAVLELGNAFVLAAREIVDFFRVAIMPHDVMDHLKDMKSAIVDFKNFSADLYAAPAGSKPDQSHKGFSLPGPAPAPTASREPDVIAKMVEMLKAKAAAELEAAAATEKGTAAALLSKAAMEAETKIAEQRASLLEREKVLRGELADAKAQEAAGVGSASATGAGGPGVRALQLEAQISGIQKMRAELEKAAPLIRQLYAEISSGEFAVKAGKDLADLAEKTDAETAASNRMAAAYRQGGQAIVEASASLKLASFEKAHSDIGKMIAGLEKLGVSADTIAPLRTAFDQLGEGIARDTAAEKALSLSKLTTEIDSQTNALRGEAEAYRITGAAALASAAAQREAAARGETAKFAAVHPEATAGLLADVYSNAIEKENQQYQATFRQQAAQLDLNKSYEDELAKLKDAKAFLEASGDSAIAIDTKIYELKISHIEEIQRQTFEAQNQELLGAKKLDDLAQELTTQWDKAALAVGSIADKFRAMANEIELAGEKLGENVFNSLSKAVDGISGQLAHFIVTGQSSFKKFFEGIAEELLKAQIQGVFAKGLEQITGAPKPGASGAAGPNATPPGFAGHVPGPLAAISGIFGIKSPSAGARGPLGTAADPIHVIAASSAGALTAGSAAGGSSTSPFYSIIADSSGNPFDTGNPLPLAPPSAGILTNLTGLAPSGSAGGSGGSGFFSGIEGMFSKIFSSLSGGLSGLMGIGKIFAGFLARGGDADRGHAYIVGEKGPELFMPGMSGSIVPSFGGFRALGGGVAAGMSYMVGEKRPEVFMPQSSSSSGGGARHTTVNFNVHGATDADSFHRSESQIYANLHAQMELAKARS